MKLLVDAGNSCLKWAWLDEGLNTGGRVLRGKKTAKAVLSEAWDECDTVPDAVLVSNVAGESFRRSLTSYIKKRWSLKAEYLTAAAEQCGVKNSYEKPETLGVDRWLAMLGAYSLKRAPLCVIDCGTAITVDVIDRDGQHKGGLIMPGMHLMRQSLVDAASSIKEQPSLSEAPPKSFLATDTGNAIIVGTLYSAIAAIDRIVGDIRAEMGNKLVCYITGGEAELFLPLIDNQIRHEAALVFKGMQAILQAGSAGEEDRPDETSQAGDEISSNEVSKPRKKTRPRKKSRASKANRSEEQGQTSEASKLDEANDAAETRQETQSAGENQASEAGEERQTGEADNPGVPGEKAKEPTL